MKRPDIHDRHDFFEYVRTDGSVPPADTGAIDVAVLDMNHSWPNIGHDSIVHALLDAAALLRPTLVGAGLRIRALSFDVRRRLVLPPAPDGRFALYVGTGGPGHLDPRQNDGVSDFSQGITDSDAWERPLFDLFDTILAHRSAVLVGVCHTFGLMCRWSGAAHPELRETKSTGLVTNALSAAAADHPWFEQFGHALPDGKHFRVVDNRLFDLVLDGGDVTPVAFDGDGSAAITIAEFARIDGLPRVWGVNHHPEIIDREHLVSVLDEKRAHGEVTEQWYRERAHTLENEMFGAAEAQSRLTSHYTFLGPIASHLERIVNERTSG